ncbi:MAG: hypothetical protein AB9842_04990 [Bacteroidales bacterium]
MTTQTVYNLIILDESGSMESIKQATINGFNEVAQTIHTLEKQFPEQRHYISLVSFNGSGIRTLIDKEPAHTLREINASKYQPNASTPLFDAIGLSVSRLRYDVQENERARFLVTILTDGEENASQEYKGYQIKAMISELTKKGWTFTYIGANHDVEKTAFSLSISNTLTFQSNDEDMKMMFEKEKQARGRFSQRIRNKEDLTDNFYQSE